MRWSRENLVHLLLWSLVVLAAFRLGRTALAASHHPAHGFACYYLQARLLLEGEPVSRIYDHEWFGDQIGRFEPGMREVTLNPPTTGFLFLPLALFPYATARLLWTWLHLALLLASACFLARRLALRGHLQPCFLAYCLLFQPVFPNINLGMVYFLLLAWLVAGWEGFVAGRDRLLGLALGCLVAFKLTAVFLPFLLLRSGRRRAVAWFAGTVAVCVAATLPWAGLAGWRAHLSALWEMGAIAPLAVTAYQSVSGFLYHLFSYDAAVNPRPLVALPGFAAWAYRTVFAAGLVLLAVCRTRPGGLAFCLFVTLNLVLNPLALDYHFVLMLLPVGVLLARAQDGASPVFVILLGAAMFLIGASLPYGHEALASGAWALLAYPKLYGAAIIAALLLWGMGQEPAGVTASSSRQSMKALTEKTARPGPGSP